MQRQQRRRKKSSTKIYRRILPSGQERYIAYYGRDAEGKQRFSKLFETRKEAEVALDQHRIEIENEGLAAYSLTADQKGEAARCFKLLAAVLRTAGLAGCEDLSGQGDFRRDPRTPRAGRHARRRIRQPV